MKYNFVEDIRNEFRYLREVGQVRKGTYEIQAASFIADKPYIFGIPNPDYIEAELQWYKSQSLNVNDIKKYYPIVPKIWEEVSDEDGYINSNYGWCIYSKENGDQYRRVRDHLWLSPDTRHATMYYTRPTMHEDQSLNGMRDHMCTYAVSYHKNYNKVEAHVYMRSNDAIFGYMNDVAWQRHVLYELCNDLSHNNEVIMPGEIYWHASSLHIYPRHWELIQ